MGLGHCEGLMEDDVYGSIASTEELMMVKTAYASDGVVDRRILSSIITPTPMDPLRALQIKWCVNGSAPKIVSSMVRKRDFVYVESSGIVMNHSMKKLNWVLSKNAAIGYAQTPEVCWVCHKNQSSSLLPKKLCRICRGRVCHTCRKPQELCFVDLHSRKVRKYKLSFCKRCVHAAHYQRTLEIAHDELVEENPWAPTSFEVEKV
ncbi:hypothetical protein PF010_g28709 [Phytophthora fragariae]|uniref:FYVE-type domain-containing protein n=1 Tax=Phytophthora fragariae TaxID=53985 RepID=A0A6A4B7U9_9STRA|nr:hypothetical protein PF009_g29565 [Phytophthora fragariae]KAE9064184.1 hypothetical protein PF010_g28709 [Phytophthora fragariae]KAE9065096.1 hypothetical protein PF007_g28963 [Phytophthora fragariae]KAE9270565.1 hypothetical protein PF001_g28750 [Phytophthora fragariae]